MPQSNPATALMVRTLLSVAIGATTTSASAQEGWEWSAEVYGWMPKISATTSSGADADLDFDSILDDLNFTFMSNIEARRDRWTLFADIIWLNIEDSDEGTLQIAPFPPVSDELKWKSRTFIGTAGAAYQVAAADNYEFNVLGGVRYLWTFTDVKLSVGPISGSTSSKDTYVDGFVGIEGSVDLNDQWYFSYYADVGTGQSDLTWQALAAFSYRFKKFDLAIGYRHLNWQFDDGSLDKLTVDGPYIGARFRF